MIWGVGTALHEEGGARHPLRLLRQPRLAEYHVPSHADIPAIEAVFLPGGRRQGQPAEDQGRGRIGHQRRGAAVANAVFNATGVRMRDYPLTLDKVLGLQAHQG
jgi:xanthine dehydrogenase YagR molybdenum-binding subunit